MEDKSSNYIIKEPEAQTVKEPVEAYLSASRLYTYADYLSWMDDKRREIIHGIVYDLLSAPSRFHAKVSVKLSFLINWFIRKRKGKCEVYYAPFDVRLPGKSGETADDKVYSVVQPDICVVCDPAKLDENGCIGAPDLIVEIQSPSTAKRDLNEKFHLYEESGVREYWVVFPRDKGVTVFLLQEDSKFDEGTSYGCEGKVPVSIFKGFNIDLRELFED
ncbi:hypothetical protein FACS189435_1930 [Bacteroidia bacterium]|nr:hypothetical protein FACS189435_1930 [Bacteroidia bacterium]